MALSGDNLKRADAHAVQLRSSLGHTRDGEPLSNNRAPAEDLSPWVARVFATEVEMDDDASISCGLIADTPVLRVLMRGAWTAETRDGTGHFGPDALLFGAQTRRMPASVRGSFATVSVALKPGVLDALGGPGEAEMLDRVMSYDALFDHDDWGTSAQMIEWFDPAGPPERWLKVAETLLRQLIERLGGGKPDPLIEAFDRAVFADPGLSIGDFASEHAVERRTLERHIKRAYGQSATQVLRRARALDIAAHLRGVADDEIAEEAALQFFDQSHMIREFKAFFGITPRAFARTPQPFMTLTLEARQARRMEVLGRKLPDQPPPWRARD